MGRNSSKVNAIARQIIAEYQINTGALGRAPYRVVAPAQFLWNLWGGAIRLWMKKLSPAMLGGIAACGKPSPADKPSVTTSLFEVNGGQYVNGKYASGKDILLDLATTAVVAEMTDILKLRKEQEERPTFACRDCGHCNDCMERGIAPDPAPHYR